MKRYTHAKIIIHVTEPKLNKIDVRLWQIDLRFVADQASVVAPIKGNKLSLSPYVSVCSCALSPMMVSYTVRYWLYNHSTIVRRYRLPSAPKHFSKQIISHLTAQLKHRRLFISQLRAIDCFVIYFFPIRISHFVAVVVIGTVKSESPIH